MASTRTCAACGRNNGPKFRRCMYCGQDLGDAPFQAAPEGEHQGQDVSPEKARALLAGLSAQARALMPADVLEGLERRAREAGGAGERRGAAGDRRQARSRGDEIPSSEVSGAPLGEVGSPGPAAASQGAAGAAALEAEDAGASSGASRSAARRRSALGTTGLGLSPAMGLGRRPVTRAEGLKAVPGPDPDGPGVASGEAGSGTEGRGEPGAAGEGAGGSGRLGAVGGASTSGQVPDARQAGMSGGRPSGGTPGGPASAVEGSGEPVGSEAGGLGGSSLADAGGETSTDLPEATTLDRMRSVDGAGSTRRVAAFDPEEEAEEDDPSIESLGTGFAIQPLTTAEFQVATELDYQGFETVSDLEPIVEELDRIESFTDLQPLTASELKRLPAEPIGETLAGRGPVTEALGRGGGFFGPRTAAYRLLLEPSEAYGAEAHWLRHRLAAGVGLDLYTATQALQRDVPSFLAAYDQPEDAQEAIGHLSEAGLSVHLVDRQEFLQDIEPIVVSSATGEPPGTVRFGTFDGLTLETPRTVFAWAALGEVSPSSEERPMVPERDRYGRRSVRVSGSFDPEGGPYALLDLFLKGQRRPLRLRSDRFDFACLGSSRSLSAIMNLRRMLIWLAADPSDKIPLDEAFKRVPAVTHPGAEGDRTPRREVEFTEYTLLLDLFRCAGA